MPELFIVATPIGNLQDISSRALEALKRVDFILCEDTRVSQKLLNHFGISKPLMSYHQHSGPAKIESILALLKQGKNLALISDAGTPGISDPGNKLIDLAIKQLNDLTIVPIPGPSALTAAASVAGCPMDKFLFMGFPPHKRKRKKFFQEALKSKYPVIIYESCHRILKTLRELRELGSGLELVVCRELTKKFETIYRGIIDKVIEKIEKDKTKGEFVVIIKKNGKEKGK
ncbi:MAG: 16S rRNA (cytidine(1402)-2'-O)-methyltransferase [Parcubacteria group bacterium CG08_land_8_20_14_0_20_43_9]|nr:MAG: 16S rRNA (cytidine(1402)-2'-O)-methyltransferase [Parcubacteria group bacterium CG08_land_8_20_14_0_20_43_9]